jgi:hypothetical protein
MFKNIIIIIIVLASNSLFAQQLPQVHQASGVVRYNGLPIHENIRVLQTTLDATELLNRNGLQLQDVTFKDAQRSRHLHFSLEII